MSYIPLNFPYILEDNPITCNLLFLNSWDQTGVVESWSVQGHSIAPMAQTDGEVHALFLRNNTLYVLYDKHMNWCLIYSQSHLKH